MALKCFKEIEGFDAVKKFYGEEISGLYFMIENFERSFCSCGKVSATMNDGCSCGKNKFRQIRQIYWGGGEFVGKELTSDYNAATDEYTISIHGLYADSSDRSKVKFSIKDHKVLTLTASDCIIHDSHEVSSIYTEHLKDYPHMNELIDICFYSKYDRYGKVKDGDVLSLNVVRDLIALKKCYPRLLADANIKRYKYLAKNYFYCTEYNTADNLSFDNLMKKYGIDAKYYEILDRHSRDNISSYGSMPVFVDKGSYWYSKRETAQEYLLKVDKENMGKKNHIYPTLYHSLNSGAIDLMEFSCILSQYNLIYNYDVKNARDIHSQFGFYWGHPLRNVSDFEGFWKKEFITLFPVYYKENLYGKTVSTLVKSFIEDLYLMHVNSIPINEDSIKLKNFNYNLNERTMAANLKISDAKIEIFLDTFDKNPLLATTLIKDRRKLTKKQLEDYMKLMEE